MRSFVNRTRLAALGLLCLTAIGCNESRVVAVAGQLTYKGKPVPNAYVHFIPEHGRPSMGETDAQGNFVLTYDPKTRGAERGRHKVWAQHNPLAAQSQPGAIPGESPRLPEDLRTFFEKYSATNSTVGVTIVQPVSDLKLAWD